MTLSSTIGIGQLEAVMGERERGKKEKDEREREGERERRKKGERGGGGEGERESSTCELQALSCIQCACVHVFMSEKGENEMVCFIILQTQ